MAIEASDAERIKLLQALVERSDFLAFLDDVRWHRGEEDCSFFCRPHESDTALIDLDDYEHEDWISVLDLLEVLAAHWIHYHRDRDEPAPPLRPDPDLIAANAEPGAPAYRRRG